MPPSGTDRNAAERPFEFASYTVVRLVRDLVNVDGFAPRGSLGFVIGKSANGSSYRVEFETPCRIVTTVAASNLIAASDFWSNDCFPKNRELPVVSCVPA